MKTYPAIEVETMEAISNIARALGDLECDRRNTIEFGTETYNLISWLGESLDSIAKNLEKIANKD
jgi:hypothetical protein